MRQKKQEEKVDRGSNKALKIAMIGHKRIPSREGGIEVVIEEIGRRLAAEGHKIYAYNRTGPRLHKKEASGSREKASGGRKEYHGIQLVNIPTPYKSKYNALIYSILGTTRALRGRYDAIHYHAEGPCAMLWLPHLFGVRTVATIHGLDWQRSKWRGFAVRYLKFGEKTAAKYADEIIVLSRNIQNYFQDTYQRRTHYIPNGIIRPVWKEPQSISRTWGLQQRSYLLFLARIVPEKGLHYLIDAFLKVETQMKLVIAGDSSHTDRYLQEVKSQAASDPRILFTGFVQGEELEELYSNAYLYVLPSDLEGMPMSLLEAMSYGNCCLVSDIPECTEVIENRAITFKKGDRTDLAKKLQYLIDHPKEAEQYREMASDYICSKYNWDDIVKETVELYRKP